MPDPLLGWFRWNSAQFFGGQTESSNDASLGSGLKFPQGTGTRLRWIITTLSFEMSEEQPAFTCS